MTKRPIKLLMIIFLPLAGLFIWWFAIYNSLKNPFDEMLYSETTLIRVTNFTPLNEVVGSSSYYKKDEVVSILTYNRSLLNENENLSIITSNRGLTFNYKIEVGNDIYFTVRYTYSDDNILLQEIHITDNDIIYKDSDLVSQLAIYGKDLEWVKAVSQDVLDDKILGLWFEKGSSRYSLNNLGNLEIEYDDILMTAGKSN